MPSTMVVAIIAIVVQEEVAINYQLLKTGVVEDE